MKFKKVKKRYIKSKNGEKKYVSIVQDPAIKVKGVAFSETKEMKFKVEGDKQIIVGPAMIPDLEIIKVIDNELTKIVFTKEECLSYHQDFMRQNISKINFDHTEEMIDAFVLYSWIKEGDNDQAKVKFGFDVPDGTVMLGIRIDNNDFWNKYVKGQEFFSFSIESIFDINDEIVDGEITQDEIDSILKASNQEKVMIIKNMNLNISEEDLKLLD